MKPTYLDDDARGFVLCPDCKEQDGTHLTGCPSETRDISPEDADQLRANYEAAQQAKAERRQLEREQWAVAIEVAQRRLAEQHGERVAADVAWARTVLVEGETFISGLSLYAALYATKKASLGRSLGWSEIARLRRVTAVLTPELVQTVAGVA